MAHPHREKKITAKIHRQPKALHFTFAFATSVPKPHRKSAAAYLVGFPRRRNPCALHLSSALNRPKELSSFLRPRPTRAPSNFEPWSMRPFPPHMSLHLRDANPPETNPPTLHLKPPLPNAATEAFHIHEKIESTHAMCASGSDIRPPFFPLSPLSSVQGERPLLPGKVPLLAFLPAKERCPTAPPPSGLKLETKLERFTSPKKSPTARIPDRGRNNFAVQLVIDAFLQQGPRHPNFGEADESSHCVAAPFFFFSQPV